jgi:hypothetical protein
MWLLQKATLPRLRCHPPIQIAQLVVPIDPMIPKRNSGRARSSAVAWAPLLKQTWQHVKQSRGNYLVYAQIIPAGCTWWERA